LYYKPNIPIAIIEAKDNNHSVGSGMQQALDYAVTLNIPFVFSSNGDGFVFHDRTGTSMEKEATLSLDAFPSPGVQIASLDEAKFAGETVLQDNGEAFDAAFGLGAAGAMGKLKGRGKKAAYS
jgi:hypothetical protein